MQNRTNKRKVFNLAELGYSGCHDFGYYHYNSVEPLLETHHHEAAIEVCFCLKGQQFYQVGDDLFKLTGNNVFIVPPNMDHSSGAYPEDIGELFWLQLKLKEDYLCYLSNEQSSYIINQLIKNSKRLFKGAFALKPLLEKLIEKLEEPKNLNNELWVNQLIIQLLLQTLDFAEKPQVIISTERQQIIEDFMDKNLYRAIYVDELAALIHISTPHLKVWFKQHFGVPPKAYINRLKIEQAKRDLLIKKSITQVAFDLGFSSSQYFATIFRKHTGITPKSYIAVMRDKN